MYVQKYMAVLPNDYHSHISKTSKQLLSNRPEILRVKGISFRAVI